MLASRFIGPGGKFEPAYPGRGRNLFQEIRNAFSFFQPEAWQQGWIKSCDCDRTRGGDGARYRRIRRTCIRSKEEGQEGRRSEERRGGKEGRSRGSPYH